MSVENSFKVEAQRQLNNCSMANEALEKRIKCYQCCMGELSEKQCKEQGNFKNNQKKNKACGCQS